MRAAWLAAALLLAACAENANEDTGELDVRTTVSTVEISSLTTATTVATIPTAPIETVDEVAGTGFSVVRALEQLPALEPSAGIQVRLTDFDAAAAVAGLTRPPLDAPADAEAISAWLLPLTGVSEFAPARAFLPARMGSNVIGQVEAVEDELGWSLSNVRWFAEYRSVPHLFTIYGGLFNEVAIDAAIPDRVDGVWRIGDEELANDPKHRTVARPLGEAIRLALDGDLLAVSLEMAPVLAWEHGERALLDPNVQAVADYLDEGGVYTALILSGDQAPSSKYLLVGAGITRGATTRLIYRFGDSASATAAAAALESIVRDGTSNTFGQPWRDIVSVVSITTDGASLIAELAPILRVDDVLNVLLAKDNIGTLVAT